MSETQLDDLLRAANLALYGDRAPITIGPEIIDEAKRLAGEVLDPETDHVRLFPASFWKALDPMLVVAFGNLFARYTIVTEELVDWLKEHIAGRRAIEIGAGHGDLGFYLGIEQTDSYANVEDPLVAERARLGNFAVARPPPSVRKLDALNAVHALRPEVTIASWVTERGMSGPTYVNGVRESAIVELSDYVLVGNRVTHGQKKILALPHEEHAFPWLVSRSKHPAEDRLWTWKRRKKRR